MYYNSFLPKLILQLEKKKKKKVKFKNNVKKYDGSSKIICMYCQIFEEFYYNKIKTIDDIIKITKNKNSINFFLQELNIIKNKIIYFENNKEKFETEIYLDEEYLKNKENDEYWDNEFFISRVHNINIRGPIIPIVRFGSRDYQYCMFSDDLIFIEQIIKSLELIKMYYIFN